MKEEFDEAVYDEQISMMEMVLDVDDIISEMTAIRDEFKLVNAYARPECRDCWAKLYCSGGCAANAYRATGDIRGVYKYGCELFKKRIECAIMMQVAERAERFE